MRATDIFFFFDTNVVLYLISGDSIKADRAEELIGAGGVISVQVLNEFASVASRKNSMRPAEIREVLIGRASSLLGRAGDAGNARPRSRSG